MRPHEIEIAKKNSDKFLYNFVGSMTTGFSIKELVGPTHIELLES